MNLKSPYFSIIIALYNAEKYLDACLSSILSQNFSDFEVVLVDDGSTDASPTICKNFEKSYSQIRYYRKENGGPLSARIFGSMHALGTYILFCDADDFYFSRNTLLYLHKITVNSNISLVQFGYYNKYNHMKRKMSAVSECTSVQREEFYSNDYPRLLCSFWDVSKLTVTVWDKCYHRDLLKFLPDYSSLDYVFMGDDLILNLFLLEHCQTAFFSPELLYVHQACVGFSTRYSKSTMQDLNIIKRYQLAFLEKWNNPSFDTARRVLFSEVAGWFYLYVKESLKHLDRDEVIHMIRDTLNLESFLATRDYYLHESSENWEAVSLLKFGDANLYVEKAIKNNDNSIPLKTRLLNLLKKVYRTI